MDVGKHSARRDGDAAEQLVQLLVILDGKGDVTGHDTALLVITGGVSGELEDLGTEVLEDGGEVHGGTGTDALSVAALLHEAGDSANGELKASLGCARDGAGSLLSFSSSSFSSSSKRNKIRFRFVVQMHTIHALAEKLHAETEIGVHCLGGKADVGAIDDRDHVGKEQQGQ